MAKSINAMGKVDAVYFTKDWMLARGCKIEREIAKAYGVKILDYDFLEEKEEVLIRTNDISVKTDPILIKGAANAKQLRGIIV